ncbi:MAG: VOC family protein, partial [Planctomycetota bacterium]
MRVLQLDHVAIHVADVEKSSGFYRDVLGLPGLPRPDFDFPGAWFGLGEYQELHLIGDRDKPVHSNHRGTHFALEVTDLGAWETRIADSGVEYLPRRTRP